MNARRIMLVVGAAGVLVSSYIHYSLYFHGGYRGFLIAWMLVVSLRWTRWATPAAIVGALFAASSLVAYTLARTSGLLGFTDDQTSTEAIIAVTAEVVAVASLGAYVVSGRKARRGGSNPVAAPTVTS